MIPFYNDSNTKTNSKLNVNINIVIINLLDNPKMAE